jgi:ubiquinone/menaquinone biosynthesis C-methylase UbiE
VDLARRLYAATYDRLGEAAERGAVGEQRARLLHAVAGDVLELGGGTGANLAHYHPGARLIVTEPDRHMRRRLAAKGAERGVLLVAATAERLPFRAASFDVVVSTFVLCSVREPAAALAEAARVLRADGRLVVLEHVRAPGLTGCAQGAMTPVTKVFCGNCHANRRTVDSLAAAGFDVTALERLPVTVAGRLYPLVAGTARLDPRLE